MNVDNVVFSDSQVPDSARTVWVNSEPANIIRLSEDGFLLPNPEADFAEELSYDYSPLNEW